MDWNPCNHLILSAGEDCKYKLWDNYGRLIYTSAPYDYVITSVAWSPNGEYFAAGAYGMLKLCDKSGFKIIYILTLLYFKLIYIFIKRWTHSFNKTNCGSLMKISWSSDGTMCSAAAVSIKQFFNLIKQINFLN